MPPPHLCPPAAAPLSSMKLGSRGLEQGGDVAQESCLKGVGGEADEVRPSSLQVEALSESHLWEFAAPVFPLMSSLGEA